MNAKDISTLLRDTYGGKVKVFAESYRELTKEVLKIEKLRQKHKSDIGR